MHLKLFTEKKIFHKKTYTLIKKFDWYIQEEQIFTSYKIVIRLYNEEKHRCSHVWNVIYTCNCSEFIANRFVEN